MLLRLLAVGAVWSLASVGWLALGGTVTSRSEEQAGDLGGAVLGLHGGGVVQVEPRRASG